MLSRLADLAHDRPRRVVTATLVIALAAGVLGGSVADRLDPYGAEDPASESVRADARIEAATGVEAGVGLVALVRLGADVSDPGARRKVDRVAGVIRREPSVARVRSFYDRRDPAMVSMDRRSTYLVASFRPAGDKAQQEAAERLEERLSSEPGVALGGSAMGTAQVNEIVASDLARAELIAFPILFLLSFLFFRSLVAALLPLLVGGLSIVLTFVVLRAAAEATSVSVFALNLVTGLGLGLAIDYSLFVVSRYREELARFGPGREALGATLATAGRTVVFSSLTIAAALASLLVFPQRFLYSMGIGGVAVALIAAVVSLVVLPAVLALLGERVNSLSPRSLRRKAELESRPAVAGFWYRLSRFVMRRPGRIAAASAALLIALGLPFAGIQFTSVDAQVLPHEASARQVDDVLTREFPPNRVTPIRVVVDASPPDASRVAGRIRRLPGVAAVAEPTPLDRKGSLVQVVSRDRALTEESQRLVREIRALDAPFPVAVSGGTADFVDQKESLAGHLPLALAIIVPTTLLVLFLMTGSLVLPIKALVMNALTLSAAFGILVLVFQDGRLEGLLDYTSQGALESSQPIVLFAVAFGLSTDYAVFLLSRIKEARDAGVPDSEAVAVGLERTGRIVTAAAVLFSVAIGAFATSQIIFIKEVGTGTALAVLIDATIVRALLVPSLMELLGGRNWWAPRQLRRLHERVGLSEGTPRAAQT